MTIEERIKSLSTDDFARFLETIHDEKPKSVCYFATRMGAKWCGEYDTCKECLRAFLTADESQLLRGLL